MSAPARMEDVHSRELWDALAEGRLRVPRCGSCRRLFFPPIGSCPNCGATEVGYADVSGRARVYSWVTVHMALDPAFAADVPYTLVTVALEEEPTARIVGMLDPGGGGGGGGAERLRDGALADVVALSRDGTPVFGIRLAPDRDPETRSVHPDAL